MYLRSSMLIIIPLSNTFVRVVCQHMTISKDILINTVRKNLAYNWIYLFFLGNERKVHRRGLFRSISLQKGIALKKQKEFANRAREIRIHRWFFPPFHELLLFNFIESIIQLLTFERARFDFGSKNANNVDCTKCWAKKPINPRK